MAVLKWGLVPSWSKTSKTEYSTINARAETIADKPAYRSAFHQKRCLIAADGFFEWHREGIRKQPYFIHLEYFQPFAFAGIWDRWERNGEILDTCSVVVTGANDLMRNIHDRMPVILKPEYYSVWMDPETTEPHKLLPLLHPCNEIKMAMHAVGLEVNSPGQDYPGLLVPLENNHGN